MKAYYDHGGIQIYHGDCREILPQLSRPFCVRCGETLDDDSIVIMHQKAEHEIRLPNIDLVLTDPPYGIGIGGAGTIGGAGVVLPKNYGISDWDNEPMSAEEWSLIKPAAPFWIVWGANHFADVIGPSHGALIWDKRCQNGWDDTFSECEIAWTNLFTRTKAFRHLWAGALRASEQGADVRQHPTQKPVALMKWCLSLANNIRRILDPYTGSGPSLIAAKECGLEAIGIEIEEKYCEITAKRLSQEVFQF